MYGPLLSPFVAQCWIDVQTDTIVPGSNFGIRISTVDTPGAAWTLELAPELVGDVSTMLLPSILVLAKAGAAATARITFPFPAPNQISVRVVAADLLTLVVLPSGFVIVAIARKLPD